MNEKLCMGCMSPLPETGDTCPLCGYPTAGINPPEYLKVNTVLCERYRIGRVLEISGDSAVYIGMDLSDNSRVTVREFFPDTLCERAEDGSLRVLGGCETSFEEYRVRFLTTVRAVARLREVPVMIPSFDIFEENGTAYSVSEYCAGKSLDRVVREGGALPLEDARRLFLPLLSAMSTIHAAGVLHCGICPKNVILDEEGHLRLKNFCIPETHTVNTDCKPTLLAGYSAPEQYEFEARVGIPSDVYGIAATLFFALTGTVPTEANARGKRREDLMMPASVADALPDHVKESLYRAMRVDPDRRTQTVNRLYDELSATSAVAALIEEEEEEDEPEEKKAGHGYLFLIFGIVLIVAAVLAFFGLRGLGVIGNTETTTTVGEESDLTMRPTTTTTIITQASGEAFMSAPDLRGKPLSEVLDMKLDGKLTVELKGYEYSTDTAKNVVLSQIPAPGEQIPRDAVIGVYVSAGSGTITLPDLNGWKEEHAKLYLEALGLRVKESMRLQVSALPKGTVEKSTPAAGSKVKAGDAITLWVSDVEQTPEQPQE